MKLKDKLILRQVAGNWVVLPLGEAALDCADMLHLNETGAMLWKVLEKGSDPEALIAALTAEYDVTQQQAQKDVEFFLQKLICAGCIEDKEETL